ncbi:Uncharacterised protein [Vibrio cholerae]|nr:Uncharacterised protein [Vibrio cholerae]CSI54376.1 Uncharacterised protein [Vibrio cholerae]
MTNIEANQMHAKGFNAAQGIEQGTICDYAHATLMQ